jgi:hypothetical protein
LNFVAQLLAIGDEAHIRDRLMGARSDPSVDFSASGLITLSPSKRTRHMSKIDRHSDFIPSPSAQEQRILTRALGCSVEELVAQLGTKNGIKRVETELRRAKRARSRKLHAFWSAVLVRIETETGERRNTKPARSAQPMATPNNDARAQD